MATSEEERVIAVSGWHACLALFERRPGDIRRILVEKRRSKAIGHVLSWAAAQRIPYRLEPGEELARVAGTTHHEGVVFLAREKPLGTREELAASTIPEGGCVLALESVANPHNLGAILRSAAFFGVGALLVGGGDVPVRLSPAVLRTSEGGAEAVAVYRVPSLADTLRDLKARGLSVIGTDVNGKNAFAARVPDGAFALVLGSEHAGITPAVRVVCDQVVRLPGSDAVESLNVSVACGIFLALFVGDPLG
jgi:TrmH RNA methyltransferase